jgi:hypothetical protein
MFWLALALAAAPAAAAVPPAAAAERGFVLDPVVVGAVDDATRVALGEKLSFAVATRARFKVISRDEMMALANLAAERQASGCDDDACMTEIAGALDARFIVRSRVTVARNVLLTVVVFDARQNSVAGRGQVEAASVDALADAIGDVVDRALDDAGALKKRRRPTSAGSAGPSGLTVAGGVGLGVAAVGAVGALAGLGTAELVLSTPSSLTSADYRNWQSIGRLSAVVGGGVALIAGATGGALFAIGALE